MRILVLALLLSLLPGLVAAQIYRWVDDDGVVHYGDRPMSDAEQAELPQLQSAKPPPKSALQEDPPPSPTAAGEVPALSLAQPEPETVFRDPRGLVPVSVALDGELPPGRLLVYYLDGTPVDGMPTRDTRIQLQGVVRGEHRVSVALVRDGRELARTPAVTFYQQPPSALSPLNEGASDDPPPAGAAPAHRSGGAPAAPRLNSGGGS